MVRSLSFPLPPHPEQQKIAQILSTWNKAIEKLEALIAAKQKRKKALMQQLLSGRKRFPDGTEDWKAFLFSDFLKATYDIVDKAPEICCPLAATDGKKFKRGATNRIALDEFKASASFQNAVDLYVFDKKLRLLVMDALERIEVGLRVDISHSLGKKDPFAYLKPELLFEDFTTKFNEQTGLSDHHQWLNKQATLISRSKEEFIKHNKTKYGFPLPIWVVCEIWDFGTLSTLFAGMTEADQDAIASKYGVSNGRIFASWLRSLNYLRNV